MSVFISIVARTRIRILYTNNVHRSHQTIRFFYREKKPQVNMLYKLLDL